MAAEIESWGAALEDWDLFELGLGLGKDLLPVVCNPGAPISPLSKMKKAGKTPSIYNREGYVAGLGKWTERETSAGDLNRWRRQSDYGICLQTRHVRALDIDVPDPAKATAIRRFIDALGHLFPVRYRENSGKCLLAFYVPGDFGKRTVKVDGGIIEFLATGQQFVAAGMHESGVPYKWSWSGLGDFPTLTMEQSEALWAKIVEQFGIAAPSEGGLRNKKEADEAVVTDAVVQELERRGLVLSYGQEGQAFIECPFKNEHTTVDEVESATTYFPAGSRGYVLGHFHCLHAHCSGRGDGEFMDAFNLTAGMSSAFDDLGPDDALPAPKEDKSPVVIDDNPDFPPFERLNTGKIKPIVNNLGAALERPDICGFQLGYDDFRGEYMVAEEGAVNGWRALEEADYMTIQKRLELGLCGFAPITYETLRRVVKHGAHIRSFDSARLWINSLPAWDGVARIVRFMPDYMGSADTPYARAVGSYIWTALAGRVLVPGIKADMAPIFFGAQGIYKSTAIELLSPANDFFTKMSFAEKDDDLSRKLRGKLVIEIDELRGLASRDGEYIKSFIARTSEHWVKKYEERTSTFLRRCLFFASTNQRHVLADDSGERRWLPAEVGVSGKIDIARLKDDRAQLWAEGAAMFQADGIDWSAEKLAGPEHEEFSVVSLWTEPVSRWLREPDIDGVAPIDQDHLTTLDILSGALNIDARHARKTDEWEVGRVMKRLGWKRVKKRIEAVPAWVWAKS